MVEVLSALLARCFIMQMSFACIVESFRHWWLAPFIALEMLLPICLQLMHPDNQQNWVNSLSLCRLPSGQLLQAFGEHWFCLLIHGKLQNKYMENKGWRYFLVKQRPMEFHLSIKAVPHSCYLPLWHITLGLLSIITLKLGFPDIAIKHNSPMLSLDQQSLDYYQLSLQIA